MEPRTTTTLYISYSRKDSAIVDKLVSQLSGRGINAIYDSNLIQDGGDWKKALMNGITNADGVLVLISPNSISSNYVMNELGLARGLTLDSKGNKLLVPVIYGEVPIPDFIGDIQVIFWKNDKEVVDRITKAVIDFRNRRKEPTKQQTEAKTKTTKTKKKSPVAPNHWLLKMNPNTWEIDRLQVGANTFFNTHYFGKERPEYKLFKEIRKGDLVLGFAAGDYQSITTLMEVADPTGPDTAQGEGFEMIVRQSIHPPIPIQDCITLIPEIVTKLRQNSRPPELFFKLEESTYNSILIAEGESGKGFENVFQPFYLTEGNHRVTDDQLDFENDISSFASVITLEKVDPPLAIGLFGNWGSGKSFFMEKLSERIEEIINSNEAGHVQNVVHVKFNSWHYSDANLWASLITQIFESLHDYAVKKEFGAETIKSIYKDLNITSQQLEETQKKLDANAKHEKTLQEQKTEVEETIDKKKETLNIWTAKDFLKIVFFDSYIQQDFENIRAQFNEENLIDNINQIDEKIAKIDGVRRQIREAISLLKKNHKGQWKWVWILAVLFAGVTWLVLGPLKEVIQDFIQGGYIVTGLAITWLTNLITKLNPYFDQVRQFHKRIKSLKQTIEKEKEKVRLKEHDEVARLNQEIADLTKSKATLESEQTLAAERKTKLENEIKEIGSGKLLASFLANKSTDDSYLKQLGIISWIRQDFKKLDEIFQKQRTVQDSEKELPAEVQIDRIVLYIDDLDRCNADVVVKVLEAIHLLLAFRLFVVIVGVDPRWLNNALSEKYKNLFGSVEDKKSNIQPNKQSNATKQTEELFSDLAGVATSYDYLEKIFQIPFALKPITKTGREKLIKYLIREELEKETNTTTDLKDTQMPPGESNPNPIPDSPLPNGGQSPEGNGINQPEAEKIKSAKKVKERLVFTSSELLYMQQISSLFGKTPRTINRYVNIYRIVKAHGSLKVVGDYSKEEFMPIMFTLAIIVGCSSFSEEFIAAISEADDGDEFKNFIENKIKNKELRHRIKPLSATLENLSMANFKRNLELISRFSFRTLQKES